MLNPQLPLDTTQRRLIGLVAVVAVLGLWSAISGFELIGRFFLPAPWEVLGAIVDEAWDADKGTSPLGVAAFWSCFRVFFAMFMVILIGVPIGILMGASPYVNAALSPLLDPFRSAPIVALVPIFVIWFGIEETMKISFLFMGAVVYLIPMVRDAVLAVPHHHYEMAIDLGATPAEAVRLAVVPMAMPRIADAIIVAVGIEWTYITVAEYVNSTTGLGYILNTARKLSQMDRVFAAIVVILAVAWLTDVLLKLIKRTLFPWEAE